MLRDKNNATFFSQKRIKNKHLSYMHEFNLSINFSYCLYYIGKRFFFTIYHKYFWVFICYT